MNKKVKIFSDYLKISEELEYYKKLVNKSAIEELIEQKQFAEKTLRKVQDLINSNEDICYFQQAKRDFNKPIDDYFRKVK